MHFNTSLVLLALALALLAGLGVYALSYLCLALFQLVPPRKAQEQATDDCGTVSVLIPSLDEGDALIDALKTVTEQDYAGVIDVYVLVRDASDSSADPLFRHFGTHAPESDREVQLLATKTRSVRLCFTGHGGKRDKLNEYLPRMETDFVAFLDADHRPTANWISSSVHQLGQGAAAAVQTRRRPLSVKRLPQMWDSIQNHVGNEALNRLLRFLGRSVFFTGTAAVFRGTVLRGRLFPESITEDTALSYQLLADGHHILYNDAASSYEEVAPDVTSYILRRRRWSAGHTRAFFATLGPLLFGRLPFAARLQMIVHGCFFLAPAAVVALLHLYGGYYLLQNPTQYQWVILGLSGLVAPLLPYLLLGSRRRPVADSLVAFACLMPLLSIQAVETLYDYANFEIFHSFVLFPWQRELFWINVAYVGVPLLVVIAGRFRFRDVPLSRFWLVLPTYPLFILLDIYACLLGLADVLLRRHTWTATRREYTVGDIPDELKAHLTRGQSVTARSRPLLLIPLVAILGFLAHELLPADNCGERRGLLWEPFLFPHAATTHMDLQLHKQTTTADSFTLEARVRIRSSKKPRKWTVQYRLDGRDQRAIGTPQQAVGLLAESVQRFTLPMGWETRGLLVTARSSDKACTRRVEFSTTVKELRHRQLFVNGEPFLIKGIVPSFPTRLGSDFMRRGLLQIKRAGANAIRVYHRPSKELMQLARELNLMVVGQPDKSTWSNIRMMKAAHRRRLVRRFVRLDKDLAGSPYSLFHHIGNELELGQGCRKFRKSICISEIMKALSEARASGLRAPLAYATFHTFIRYRADILGINMLDTGSVYWGTTGGASALDNLQNHYQGAFYASELGGFIAGHEVVSPELRAARFVSQWRRLQQVGALGAFVFHSHDNWAQPVLVGINDPFSPDHPDDLRGIWDHDNRPKLLRRFVARVFADLELKHLAGSRIRLRNRRAYSLHNVRVLYGRSTLATIAKLPPGSSTNIAPPNVTGSEGDRIRVHFTSHGGLRGQAELWLRLPTSPRRPKALNHDFVVVESTPNRLRGRVLVSRRLRVILPRNWKRYRLNGVIQKAPRDRIIAIAIPNNPFRPVVGLEYSRNGGAFAPYPRPLSEEGHVRLRFTLPAFSGSPGRLILQGLGTGEFHVTHRSRTKRVRAHLYREVHVNLQALGAKPRDAVTVHFVRSTFPFADGQQSLSGQTMPVYLEKPVVFAPYYLDLERVD